MIKCPNCGASHYSTGPSMRTAVYYPPIWQDGININPDMNTTTTQAHCCECHYDFKIKHRGGKEWVEKGEYNPPKPPINANLTATSENYTPVEAVTSMATLNIKNNEVMRLKYKWERDIEKLNQQVERLTKMVDSLWRNNTHDVLDEEE